MAVSASTLGLLLSNTSEAAADQWVYLSHQNLTGADDNKGTPLLLRKANTTPAPDLRSRTRIYYTDSAAPAYTWTAVGLVGSGDIASVEVADTSILTASVATGSSPARKYILWTVLRTGVTQARISIGNGVTTHYTTDWFDVHCVGDMLFTDEQYAALQAGAPVAQKFTIINSDGTEHIIHDETDVGSLPPRTVVDRGSRSYRAVNITPVDDENLTTPEHTIEVVSTDSIIFSPGDPSSVWAGEEPQASSMRHEIYIFVAGAWSEVSFVRYTGKVESCLTAGSAGRVSSRFTISTKEVVADVFRTVFTQDHGSAQSTGLTFSG